LLHYDNVAKQLSFYGVLDAATENAIIAAAAVNTTDSKDNVAAGNNVTLSPAAMTNIVPGMVLMIDSGAAQETIVVTAITATSFTTSTLKAHNGTTTPFAIVNDPSLIAALASLATTSFTTTTVKAHNGTATPFAIVNDPSFVTALASLAAANKQAIAPFFANYPELLPIYTAYAQSSDPIQTKRNALLNNFLPTLKRMRKEEQALAAITAAVGSDPSFASTLLQNPTILHADIDPTAAAVTDLTAIEATGLSAQFFLGNNPVAPADQSVDNVTPVWYVQTATITGTITSGVVLTTTINGIAIPYTVAPADTSLAILASNVAASINAATTVDSTSGLPINRLVSAAILPEGAGNVIAISGLSPMAANSVFSLACSASAGSLTYTAGSQLPAGNGGGPIAGIWSGYITVPQNGFYNVSVVTDAGAKVTLQIDSEPVAGGFVNGVWVNQSPISLLAGTLVHFVLTAQSIKTTLALNWQSPPGLGWEIIPGQYLYPQKLVDRLSHTYVRFLKATSLASALSLVADEIAYLGTDTDHAVNTTCVAKVAAGSAQFTPLSMANIKVGSVLVIDTGTAQETVTVTAVAPSATPPTFTAVAAHAHDGTVTPFPIVGQSAPDIESGWLNFLPGQPDPGVPNNPIPDLATAARLTQVLIALLDFSRIKQVLSPNDERLLELLQSPAASLPNGQTALQSLTGWAPISVNALLTQFFGNSSLANLANIKNLRRVYDAYQIVQTCRVTASILISAVTNVPTATGVSALQSALRALYAESDWLTVVRPINDTMRIRQRDALVAYILQQLGNPYANSLVCTTSANAVSGATQVTLSNAAGIAAGQTVQGVNIAPGTTVFAISGTTVTLNSANSALLGPLSSGSNLVFIPAVPLIDTADKLYEFLLIDPETQPPVETSRIRLALSAVQLFIERIVRNLEPLVSPTDVDATQWEWMKRYRVWQANREVFLWPENWLYPELRDDQSPFFQDMMSALLQSDITDDAATEAYLNYLTSLEEVAKLEPCGLYYVPSTADSDEISYVVARTAGAHRKYYFRQFQGGSWTPWTEVKIDCEDMPLTPIVWNSGNGNRLFLFWLKILKQTQPPQSVPQNTQLTGPNTSGTNITSLSLNDFQAFATSAQTQNQSSVIAQAVLCWSEFYNGKWQPTKTSDINRPTTILGPEGIPIFFDPTGPNSFDVDRNLVRIVPAQCTGNWTIFDEGIPLPSIPSDALILAISTPYNPFASPTNVYSSFPGFLLHNTHSLPIRLEDISVDSTPPDNDLRSYLDEPAPARVLPSAQSYNGGNDTGTLTIQYYDTLQNFFNQNAVYTANRLYAPL
jgi:hypothetical protein